jgi:hypothetical protein
LGDSSAAVSGIMHRLTHMDLNSKFDEELTVVWLQDLPLGLQQLQLSRYAVVLPYRQQQREQPQHMGLAAGSSSSSSSSSSGGVCSRLDSFSLLDCCVLGLTEPLLANQQQKQDSSNASHLTSSSSGPDGSRATHVGAVWPIPTHHLLQLLGPRSTDLELQVPLFDGDVEYICSQLGSNLQRLHLQAAAWFSAGSEQRVAWGIAAAFAAAAGSGQLQQLRDLAVDFTALQLPDNALQRLAAVNAAAAATTAGAGATVQANASKKFGSLDALGIGLLRVCCGFRSLKHLKLAVDLQHCRVTLGSSSGHAYDTFDSAQAAGGFGSAAVEAAAQSTGFFFCSSSSSSSRRVREIAEAPEGPTGCSSARLCSCSGAWDLPGLQHLRVLDVLLRVPSLAVLGDLAPGVLGRCRGCGGGVGLEAVRLFLKHGLPEGLPTCEVRYEEVSKSF